MTPNQQSYVLALGRVFVKCFTFDGSIDCMGLTVIPALS